MSDRNRLAAVAIAGSRGQGKTEFRLLIVGFGPRERPATGIVSAICRNVAMVSPHLRQGLFALQQEIPPGISRRALQWSIMSPALTLLLQ